MSEANYPIQNREAFDKACRLSGHLLDCGLEYGATPELCKIPIASIEVLETQFRYFGWHEHAGDAWQWCGGRYWGQGHHTEAHINAAGSKIVVCDGCLDSHLIKEFDVEKLLEPSDVALKEVDVEDANGSPQKDRKRDLSDSLEQKMVKKARHEPKTLYDAPAWILESLTDITCIQCMPPDMVKIIRDPSGRLDIDFNELLKKMRTEIKRHNDMNEMGIENGSD